MKMKERESEKERERGRERAIGGLVDIATAPRARGRRFKAH